MSGPRTLVLTGSNAGSGENEGHLLVRSRFGNGGSGESLASPTDQRRQHAGLRPRRRDDLCPRDQRQLGQVVKLGTRLAHDFGSWRLQSRTFTIESVRRAGVPGDCPSEPICGASGGVILRNGACPEADSNVFFYGSGPRQCRSRPSSLGRGSPPPASPRWQKQRRGRASGIGPLSLITTDATPKPTDRGQQQREKYQPSGATTRPAISPGARLRTAVILFSSAGTLVKVGSGTLTMSQRWWKPLVIPGRAAGYTRAFTTWTFLGGEVIYSNSQSLPGFRESNYARHPPRSRSTAVCWGSTSPKI